MKQRETTCWGSCNPLTISLFPSGYVMMDYQKGVELIKFKGANSQRSYSRISNSKSVRPFDLNKTSREWVYFITWVEPDTRNARDEVSWSRDSPLFEFGPSAFLQFSLIIGRHSSPPGCPILLNSNNKALHLSLSSSHSRFLQPLVSSSSHSIGMSSHSR